MSISQGAVMIDHDDAARQRITKLEHQLRDLYILVAYASDLIGARPILPTQAAHACGMTTTDFLDWRLSVVEAGRALVGDESQAGAAADIAPD